MRDACLHTPCLHICRRCHAAALDAYAETWINQDVLVSRNQRDDALAKLEAAEADWRMEKGVRDVLAKRVRALEAALREITLPCHDFDCDERPAIARVALAKAAAEHDGGTL